MHDDRTKETEALSDLHAAYGVNRDHWPLVEIVKTFTRPMRGRPDHLILDGFDHEYFLMFDFGPDPENPKFREGNCDIELVPLPADDFIAESLRLVSNANKFGVMRLLAALGLDRFDDKVKTAFYASSNPLRAMAAQPAD